MDVDQKEIKPPTLCLGGKRSLLEHCLRFVNGKSPKPFFNLLFTSKSFFDITKRHEVYCLDLHSCEANYEGFCLAFMNMALCKSELLQTEKCTCITSNRLEFSRKKTFSFVSLLKPTFFSLTLQRPDFSGQILKNCIALLGRVTGKIAILTGIVPEDNFVLLMELFANKIHSIVCPAELFLKMKDIPFPELNYCQVYKAVNRDQLDDVLDYKNKALFIEVNDKFFDVPDKSDDPDSERLDVCESLQFLTLTIAGFAIIPLQVIDQVSDRCPNLRKVRVEIPFEFEGIWLHRHVTETDAIVRVLLGEHQNAKLLMQFCEHWDYDVSIQSNLAFSFDPKYDGHDWIKELEQNDEFKNVTFSDIQHPNKEHLRICEIKYEDRSSEFKQSVHVVYEFVKPGKQQKKGKGLGCKC